MPFMVRIYIINIPCVIPDVVAISSMKGVRNRALILLLPLHHRWRIDSIIIDWMMILTMRSMMRMVSFLELKEFVTVVIVMVLVG